MSMHTNKFIMEHLKSIKTEFWLTLWKIGKQEVKTFS